jgi:hypothetical protein
MDYAVAKNVPVFPGCHTNYGLLEVFIVISPLDS